MYLEVVLWEGVRSDSSEYSLWVDDVRDDMGGISAAMLGRVTDSVGVGGDFGSTSIEETRVSWCEFVSGEGLSGLICRKSKRS